MPSDTTPDANADERERLVARCLEEIETSGTAAVERLCREHPDHAAHLRAVMARLHGAGLLDLPVAAPVQAVSVPERLGRYRLLQRLGEGGMGVVYLADQEVLGRRVALKIVRPDLLHVEGARARLLREVAVAARLSHPGIVAVHDFGEEDGTPFFSMEWLRGCSLADLVHDLRERDPAALRARDALDVAARRAGEAVPSDPLSSDPLSSDPLSSDPLSGDPLPGDPLPGDPLSGELAAAWQGSYVQACLRMALCACQALAHAHAEGVVHRDVKPSNVMLTSSGRVVLLDFGLAQQQGATRITRTGVALGSLAYMAPEQVCGQATDARTDVYALGVTLYELLALRPAFAGDDPHDIAARIVEGDRPGLRAVQRTVPRDVETVVHKAMEREPALRYASAADLAADLGNLLELRPIAARRPGALARLRRHALRHRARTAAILCAFALALGLPSAWFWAAQQTRAADARADEVFFELERFADQLHKRLGEDELASLPGGADAQRQLVGDILGQYERLRELRPDDERLVLRSARVHRRLGQLLTQLSAHTQAKEALERAGELAAGLRGRAAAALEVELGAYNGLLSLALTTNQLAAARAAGDRALAALATSPDPHPTPIVVLHSATLNFLARLAERTGDAGECRRLLEDALDLASRRAAIDPTPQLTTQRGHLQCERARVRLAGGDRTGARADFEQGLALLRDAQQQLPGDELVEARIAGVALAYGVLLLRDGELDAAGEVLALGRGVFEARRRRYPDHVGPLSSLGAVLHNQAMLARARGDSSAAESLVAEALELQKAALARGSGDVQHRTYVANHSLFLAQVRIEQGKHAGLDDLLAVVPELRGEPLDHVLAARLWLLRAAAAAADPALDAATQHREHERCAAAGLRALAAAVAGGFKDAQMIARDRAFADWWHDPQLTALLDLMGEGK